MSGGDQYLLRPVGPVPTPMPSPQPVLAPLSVTTLEKQIKVLGEQFTKFYNEASGLGTATYVHTQSVPEEEWVINHILVNKFPSVTVVDSAGTEVIGEVNYIGTNQVVLNFGAAFSGKAFLN